MNPAPPVTIHVRPLLTREQALPAELGDRLAQLPDAIPSSRRPWRDGLLTLNVRRNETDLLFRANRRLIAEARGLGFALDGAASVPGRLEEREGVCLYVLARRAAELGNVVEIGSLTGRSTCFLARALEDAVSPYRVVAIDPHEEGTQGEFAENIRRSGLAHRVDPRLAYSHDVALEFDEPVGFVWVDGDHSYAGVRQDFLDWFPRLPVGGWIAFHDTANRWLGPTKLVRELLTRRDDLAEVGQIGLITYARKAAPSATNRVSALVARLGFEAVTLLWDLRMGRGPLERAPGDP